MKKLITLSLFIIVVTFCKAQVSYTPFSEQDLHRIERILLQRKLDNILNNTSFTIGAVDLYPIENFLSYNPIEGVRIRVSGKTNAKLSKRFNIEWLAAYGTMDKKFKYHIGFNYNFTTKSKINLSYFDNTYMPYLSDYDKIQYSLSPWDYCLLNYYRKATLSYYYKFPIDISLNPSLHYQNLYSSLYYNGNHVMETLSHDLEYIIAQLNTTYQPRKHPQRILSIKYAFYNPLNQNEETFSKITFLAQERVKFTKNLNLDLRLSGGKILGNPNTYLHLTPTMSNSYISSIYGLNLLPYSQNIYHLQYLQTLCQINYKTKQLDLFVYHKSLFGQHQPHHEIGVGVDRILKTNLGLELIYSPNNDMWGVKIRIR